MRSRTKAWRVALLVLGSLLVVTSAASARTCSNGKDSNGPMWLSILHPGLGEWALNGWGPFGQNAPDRPGRISAMLTLTGVFAQYMVW